MRTRLLALLASLLLAAARAESPSLDRLVADPQLWPKEVTVLAAAKATVLRNGQPAGMMLVGAGKKLTVTGIAADGVTGKLGGATVKVAVDKTNLLSGAGEAAVVVAAVDTPEVAAPAPAGGAPTAMQRQLSSKLVKLQNGKVGSLNTDTALAGVKYYAIYYSASWCGPCRQFTPQLAQYYWQMKQKHPEFEVVFVSSDRSAGDMAGYMKEDRMPWPALKYELAGNSGLQRYAGPGIPCLVLLDANGRVLSHSFDGDNYLGPGKVLQDMQRILAKGS